MALNYGLKVSKDGKEATSNDVADLVFSSAFSTVKILKDIEGTISVPARSGSTYGSATVTIRHDLGFVPVVMLYFESTPGSGKWTFGVPFNPLDDCGVDASQTGVTNIKFLFTVFNKIDAVRVVKYHVYIFGDPV